MNGVATDDDAGAVSGRKVTTTFLGSVRSHCTSGGTVTLGRS
jgi:hypothetical protein